MKAEKNKTINFCNLPTQVPPKEAKIYKMFLRSHCDASDKEDDNHQCQGVLSISRNAIVLRCKRCGDAKGSLEYYAIRLPFRSLRRLIV